MFLWGFSLADFIVKTLRQFLVAGRSLRDVKKRRVFPLKPLRGRCYRVPHGEVQCYNQGVCTDTEFT